MFSIYPQNVIMFSIFFHAAEEAKASDADGAVQSTPVAKSASGRKTTRRAVKKAVKKSPASSKTTSDNTLVSEDAGTAMLEDPVEEKDAKDSKEDHGNEKDAAGSTECVEEGDTEDPKEDYVTEEAALESKESIKEGDTEDTEEVDVKEEDAEDPKEDPVKEKDLQDPKKDTAKPKGAEDLKEDIVKEKVAEDSEENAIKEKNAEESKEDLVMGEAAEDSKEYPIEEEGAESSKEDVAKEKDGEELKEDLVREEDAEDSKEYPMMEKNREDSEESAVMEEDAEDSKEDPAKEEDAEDLKENPVMGEDAEDSKEDPVKEKDAEGLNDAGPTPMYETNEKIEESSNNLVSTAKNVGDSVDQNGNKEEHAGDAQGEPALNTIMSLDEVTVAYDVRLSEKIGHDVRTSENQGPAVTYVKSQEPTIEDMKSSDSQELTTTELKCQEGEGSNKGKEGLELRGEKNDGSTPTGDNVKNEQCAEDRMEEDTDRKMKGKDISLDEAGEDKIEDFADEENGEEFVEDDVPEHCEEAETLEDERAQLNALAKERKKRRELEVFVGGLDRDAVEEDLKRVFQHVGEVVDVRMHRELSTNKNKGYAFVKFATKEQVSRALAEMRNPVVCFFFPIHVLIHLELHYYSNLSFLTSDTGKAMWNFSK